MKTTKIITLAALLTLLATGCMKDNIDPSHIRILAEDMTDGNGSKVWVNPTTGSTSSSALWKEGEPININGANFVIDKRDGHYYLSGVPTDGMRYAVYPNGTIGGGNSVEVTNNGDLGATITLHQLAVNFRTVNAVEGHDIAFPMAARTAADADTMRFHHLTGGFRLTLANNTATTLYTVKVVVQGSGAAEAVPIYGVNYTTQWAVEGPTLPNDTVGQISGDVNVRYSSEMHFVMQTDGNPGVTIPASGSKTFCVPVTVSTVKRLTISGYDNAGNQLFVATKEMSNIPVECNKMYNIPTIQIN